MAIGDLQRENDTPLGSADFRSPMIGEPEAGDTLVWDATLKAFVPSAFLQIVAVVGYGGVNQQAPVAISNISTGFQTLPTDSTAVTTPVSVIQDVANDGIHFERTGVWMVAIGITLEYTELNAGRTFDLQLFDADEAAVIDTTPIFSARNVDGTNFTATIMVEITPTELDDLIVLRVGNASTDFTGVSVDVVRFDAWHIGPVGVVS